MTNFRIAVIADDFTGAMDTGVMFANYGLHTEFCLSQDPALDDVEVIVFSTGSREKNIETAVTVIKQLALQFVNRRLFKKIDSTMRGHIAAEIVTLLQITGIEKALICPSAISAGRIVRDGILFVKDTPLHETAFANDPHYPAITSSVQEILSHSSSMHIDLDDLNRGNADVLNKIRQSSAKLISCDAESDEDLTIISQIAIEGKYMPCGSMGLARAWVDMLLSNEARGSRSFSTKFSVERPILIVTGSRHPASEKQIEALVKYVSIYIKEISEYIELSTVYDEVTSQQKRHDAIVLRTPNTRIEDHTVVHRIYQIIGDLVKRLCDESQFAGMVVIGGETAFHVCHSLGADSIRILGEIELGVPVGQMIGGCANSLPIVTKAGGFGTDFTLCHVLDWLKLQY